MAKRLNGGSSPRNVDLYKQHSVKCSEHKLSKLEKNAECLNKRYPNNKYKVKLIKNHKGKDIYNIKLIEGTHYKKPSKKHRERFITLTNES